MFQSFSSNRGMLIPREMEGKREVIEFKDIKSSLDRDDKPQCQIKTYNQERVHSNNTLCFQCISDLSVANV